MARKANSKVPVNLKLDRELIKQVRELADEEGRTYSGQVEQALRQFMAGRTRRRRMSQARATAAAS